MGESSTSLSTQTGRNQNEHSTFVNLYSHCFMTNLCELPIYGYDDVISHPYMDMMSNHIHVWEWWCNITSIMGMMMSYHIHGNDVISHPYMGMMMSYYIHIWKWWCHITFIYGNEWCHITFIYGNDDVISHPYIYGHVSHHNHIWPFMF